MMSTTSNIHSTSSFLFLVHFVPLKHIAARTLFILRKASCSTPPLSRDFGFAASAMSPQKRHKSSRSSSNVASLPYPNVGQKKIVQCRKQIFDLRADIIEVRKRMLDANKPQDSEFSLKTIHNGLIVLEASTRSIRKLRREVKALYTEYDAAVAHAAKMRTLGAAVKRGITLNKVLKKSAVRTPVTVLSLKEILDGKLKLQATKKKMQTPLRSEIKTGTKLNKVLKKALNTPVRDQVKAGGMKQLKKIVDTSPIRAADNLAGDLDPAMDEPSPRKVRPATTKLTLEAAKRAKLADIEAAKRTKQAEADSIITHVRMQNGVLTARFVGADGRYAPIVLNNGVKGPTREAIKEAKLKPGKSVAIKGGAWSKSVAIKLNDIKDPTREAIKKATEKPGKPVAIKVGAWNDTVMIQERLGQVPAFSVLAGCTFVPVPFQHETEYCVFGAVLNAPSLTEKQRTAIREHPRMTERADMKEVGPMLKNCGCGVFLIRPVKWYPNFHKDRALNDLLPWILSGKATGELLVNVEDVLFTADGEKVLTNGGKVRGGSREHYLLFDCDAMLVYDVSPKYGSYALPLNEKTIDMMNIKGILKVRKIDNSNIPEAMRC